MLAQKIESHWLKKYKPVEQSYTINNIKLFPILSISKLQDRIVNLSYTLFLDLIGDLKLLDSYSYDESGPSKKVDEALEKEKITTYDLINSS